MTIRIGRSRLLDGLKKVQAAANAKSAMPIYAYVKVSATNGKMAMTTTDGDITLHAVIDAQVDEAGEIAVPVAPMLSSVSKMDEGEVTIQTEKDKVRILGGKYKMNMPSVSAQEFPKINADKAVREFRIKAKSLSNMLKRVAYAQSADDTRRVLESVLVEIDGGKIVCVATDGRRLAVAEEDGCVEPSSDKSGETFKMILPTRTVGICQRFLDSDGDVVISSYGSQVSFAIAEGEDRVFTRLIDDNYPNYKQVIPKGDMIVAKADRTLLMSALDRMAIMDNSGDVYVKMTFERGMLKMEIHSDFISCDATDEVPISYDGEKVEIHFNPKYVIDPLSKSDSDDIEIRITDGTHPAVINDDENSFFCVLMPMRVH